MVFIYCIEDINDLKYVGSTKQTLPERMRCHIYQKKNMKSTCSSTELNLHNSIIYVLEECSEEDRKEREQYWIDNTDCVNQYNARRKVNKQEYQKQYMVEYRKKNREKHNLYKREWRKLKKEELKNNNL